MKRLKDIERVKNLKNLATELKHIWLLTVDTYSTDRSEIGVSRRDVKDLVLSELKTHHDNPQIALASVKSKYTSIPVAATHFRGTIEQAEALTNQACTIEGAMDLKSFFMAFDTRMGRNRMADIISRIAIGLGKDPSYFLNHLDDWNWDIAYRYSVTPFAIASQMEEA